MVDFGEIRIAVLIPCYNEELTIAKVISDFKRELPMALIYVYDNNSVDNTYDIAMKNNVIVRREKLQGKGNVVRRMFADIDADVYVLVDGDSQSDSLAVRRMITKLLDENLDMVVACRKGDVDVYRMGHKFGGKLFSWFVALLFGQMVSDIFSGYRVFSRRFVKTFPASSKKYEIEVELTVHALQQRLAVGEVESSYYKRPNGSVSKLRTYLDGWCIFKFIVDLIISERPLILFGFLFVMFMMGSVCFLIPVLREYFLTGLVPRFPTLFVSGFMGVLAIIYLFFGYLYDRVSQMRREVKHFFYLQQGDK